MKVVKLKSSILSCVCALLALIPNLASVKDGGVKEIGKPYLGVYECTSAQLGDLDLLAEFSHIHLELKKDEQFVLYYQTKSGKAERAQGKYFYDEEKQVITLQLANAKCFQREFPLKKGQLTITFPLGKRQLCLIFEQK